MKNEHEFNAYFTKTVKKMGTIYKIIKASDRFKLGVPDWLIIHDGKIVALESKFVKSIPSRGKILDRQVTMPQVSFLKSIALAGGRAYVIVGIQEIRKFIVAPYIVFNDGNITVEEYRNNPGLFTVYSFGEEGVQTAILDMFTGFYNG
jgi:hypothetical protein